MSELIDTPAEGFPLPTMTPPTRRLRDVARALTPGSKARAVQRSATSDALRGGYAAGHAPDGLRNPPASITRPAPDHDASVAGFAAAAARIATAAALAHENDLERERAAGSLWLTSGPGYAVRISPDEAAALHKIGVTHDDEIDRRLDRIVTAPAPAPANVLTAGMIGDYLGQWRAREATEREALTRAAFAGGRAYERGATLRRGVGKSFGSRRVQAEGVASDYLRDDPQDGARLAALVLAGFAGQDPETIR